VGVFIDVVDDYVAFSGSSNESKQAFEGNYECVDVYLSWKDEERSRLKREHFERLWDGDAGGVFTFSFPDAAKRELLRISERRLPDRVVSAESDDLWPHQREAISAFLEARRGILEMATGTGKTYTAVEIMRHLVVANRINSVIVTASGTDLLDQWVKQLNTLATTFTPKYRVLRHYEKHHQRDEFELGPKHSILLVSRTAVGSVLRKLSPDQKRSLLIVHDEVHGLGSRANVESLDGLSNDITYRLGLSATPEREYDIEGTDFIERNVGPVIFTFPLQDAIRQGILCEFDYYPLEYAVSADDRERLKAIYKQKAARAAEGKPMSDQELGTALARVHKTSLEKLPLFEKFVADHPNALNRSIVFVAEKEYGEKVLDIIHGHRYDFHTYYAEDDRANLVEFSKGAISCLITCHRLSEGIDVKSIGSIVLFAADRTRLETIQRIGRCLRIDPENPNKRAMVVDFCRTQNPEENEPNSDQLRRKWLTELSNVRREVIADGS
jgi:superfamily II DNA or RNA helicase